MRSLIHAVIIGLVATPTLADCAVEALAIKRMDFSLVPPTRIDLSLRPVIPECLVGLTDPKLEDCPRDGISAFGTAVKAWSDALHEYVNDTNRFANELTNYANRAIVYAQEARRHADAALDFANCEAAEISGSSK